MKKHVIPREARDLTIEALNVFSLVRDQSSYARSLTSFGMTAIVIK
jgi:hypothetical protein